MHVAYHIDPLAHDRYGVWFTVHKAKHDGSLIPAIELEQAFTERITALLTLIGAVGVHMRKRYGLGKSEFTIEEK